MLQTELNLKQECIPVECISSAAVAAGGVSAGGVCLPGVFSQGVCVFLGGLSGDVCPGWRLPRGACLPGGYLPRGVCHEDVCWGVCPSACWDTPPRGQNDRHLWKYYLASTTLRTVKKLWNVEMFSLSFHLQARINNRMQLIAPVTHLFLKLRRFFRHTTF